MNAASRSQTKTDIDIFLILGCTFQRCKNLDGQVNLTKGKKTIKPTTTITNKAGYTAERSHAVGQEQ